MNDRLRELSEDTLRRLANAVATERVGPPWPSESIAFHVGGPEWIADELRRIAADGVSPRALAWTLGLLIEEREASRRRWEGVELTWTGPDDVATETRDTGAVARQLFATATNDLLVATYAIDDDSKAAALLGVLRERMAAVPTLRVRFFVNIAREFKDDRPEDVLVREYAMWFSRRV